jgi:amino-acid N-acetyltransferase
MLRKANLKDAPAIHALLKHWAQKEVLMPRSLSDICDDLRDFFVFEGEDAAGRGARLVGCGALHLTWTDLAEVRSVAVDEACQHRGIGTALVEACLAEARALEVPRVFVLTFVPSFFERFGFHQVPKETFPHKIWLECVDCRYFPDCKEVAMALELKADGP